MTDSDSRYYEAEHYEPEKVGVGLFGNGNNLAEMNELLDRPIEQAADFVFYFRSTPDGAYLKIMTVSPKSKDGHDFVAEIREAGRTLEWCVSLGTGPYRFFDLPCEHKWAAFLLAEIEDQRLTWETAGPWEFIDD